MSLFLGKGAQRLKIVGLINFYRYLVQEYYFIHGVDQSVVSLVKPDNEPKNMVATFPFFKKKFLFKFFQEFKKVLIFISTSVCF